MNEVEKKLYDLGRCIGMAVGIQCVRNGGPISKLSQRAAWELGSDGDGGFHSRRLSSSQGEL